MDVLHAVYERLIRWAFWPPLSPAAARVGRPFDADGRATRPRRAAALATSRRAAWSGRRRAASSARSGWRRWWAASSCRRPTRASPSCASRMPIGSSLERSDAKVRQVEEIVRHVPRGQERLDQRRRPGHGLAVGRNQAVAEHRPGRPQRAQAHAEGGRGRDPRADRQDPGHRGRRSASTGRSTSPSSAATRGPGAHRHRLRREGQARSPASPTSSCRSSPACRPTRCA